MACYKFGEIILPENFSVENWSVVACDQYTSDKQYWDNLYKTLKEPTSLNLIFPECYLSSDNSARINRVIEKQKEYISGGIFRKVEGTVLVKRNTLYGNERWGLMCLIDLDAYSFDLSDKTLIRATEGLVASRIPPRMEIRRNCLIELPHVMLLIDDENRTVIEPLKGKGKVLYDGTLNSGGGHITGYNITDTSGVTRALDNLLRSSKDKYGSPLLFLVGDGNHSLATAKACRDENNPLSRYALVEIVNIYDEGLKFEPIYRVIYNVDNEKFLTGLKEKTASQSGKTSIYMGGESVEISFPTDAVEGVKIAQDYIDEYLAEYGGEVDYIHGLKELKEICRRDNALGIELAPMDKASFFSYVAKNGLLPRKTFSMGEADEKRFYTEARYIK